MDTDTWSDELALNEQMWGSLTLTPITSAKLNSIIVSKLNIYIYIIIYILTISLAQEYLLLHQ